MPQLRQNLATKEWVIVSTERAKRPEDFISKREKKIIPAFSEKCPFCPGNEAQTPPEKFSIKDPSGAWLVRVTNNKFAALSETEEHIIRKEDGTLRSASGYGIHEVIIETPQHNGLIATMEDDAVLNILRAYKQRYNTIAQLPKIDHIIVFKNHGEAAGTSLEHPHSQVVGLPVVPSGVRQRVEEGMQYYDSHGRCAYCRMLDAELKSGDRIIQETTHFAAFVLYAANGPFHIWIVPKKHTASFGDICDEQLEDLVIILKSILEKLYYGLQNPDFNYVVRTIPIGGANTKYFHWYISIVPRLTKMAGFELGTGMFINVSLPEENAKFLRQVAVPKT
jgi:UDPglucose--hexose-1-phosphate uridylyltransferase